MATNKNIYYGEELCQKNKKSGQKCNNRAYYSLDGQYVCGVHSSRQKTVRIELPQNPNKKAEVQNEMMKRKC